MDRRSFLTLCAFLVEKVEHLEEKRQEDFRKFIFSVGTCLGVRTFMNSDLFGFYLNVLGEVLILSGEEKTVKAEVEE